MTNGIKFYSKVDYIPEFLKKRSSVCVWVACPSAKSVELAGDVSVFILSRCRLVQGMQRQRPR